MSLLLKRSFICMCTSLSLFLLCIGWVGFGGGVDLLGDDGIKPTNNQVAGCLKKFQCSDLFFFVQYQFKFSFATKLFLQ